jgi:hypothetical protein
MEISEDDLEELKNIAKKYSDRYGMEYQYCLNMFVAVIKGFKKGFNSKDNE